MANKADWKKLLHVPSCRHCHAALTVTLADLGMSPVANDYVDPVRHAGMEPFYPLEVLVCPTCRLAQTRDVLGPGAVFREDYAYFSSHSTSWLDHARRYVEEARERFHLNTASLVVEIASNDGYLLQYVRNHGIGAVGIEPCKSVADAAIAKGIDTRIKFFGRGTARALAAEGLNADLIVANNVLAHVPDINDFVGGIAILLKPEGVATFEVHHLLRLMQRRQFDTIYHEHFSYLSLVAAQKLFAAADLRVFDVEELTSHGGSIRFFVCRAEASQEESPNVARVLAEERDFGLERDETYEAWGRDVHASKRALLKLLVDLKDQGKSIAAYGAPAKGVTLLNFCGIGRDFIDFTVDLAPSKQNRLLPGVHIPILSPDALYEMRPDYVVILPWNIEAEIVTQCAGIRDWGGKFIVPVPSPRIVD
ncbi:MAG: class I SAM-dependent methyltransferase [Hyphomonadaceae bacterium]|nr:class I SAM-dependent methyltransferase [Hyphomonadaceae bacterium]